MHRASQQPNAIPTAVTAWSCPTPAFAHLRPLRLRVAGGWCQWPASFLLLRHFTQLEALDMRPALFERTLQNMMNGVGGDGDGFGGGHTGYQLSPVEQQCLSQFSSLTTLTLFNRSYPSAVACCVRHLPNLLTVIGAIESIDAALDLPRSVTSITIKHTPSQTEGDLVRGSSRLGGWLCNLTTLETNVRPIGLYRLLVTLTLSDTNNTTIPFDLPALCTLTFTHPAASRNLSTLHSLSSLQTLVFQSPLLLADDALALAAWPLSSHCSLVRIVMHRDDHSLPPCRFSELVVRL
jgi:hypothetical protein